MADPTWEETCREAIETAAERIAAGEKPRFIMLNVPRAGKTALLNEIERRITAARTRRERSLSKETA